MRRTLVKFDKCSLKYLKVRLEGIMLAACQTVLQGAVVALMVYLQLNQARSGACLSRCLCAADILSCSALGLEGIPETLPVFTATLDLNHNQIRQLEAGSFQGLVRLEVLRLAHNQLATIQPGAFGNSSGGLLRHLDLSSNQLDALEQSYFLDLPGLEELLLFNNRIVRVESSTLSGLVNLQRVYLSHNRLTDFPFFSLQRHSHPQLSLLDLSSNRLPKLPLADIANLPPSLQRGIYLHNNSLLCDCSMYSLLSLWERRGFASVRFLREEHVCLVPGIQRSGIRFFKHRRYFDRCNTSAAMEAVEAVELKEGEPLLLRCNTSLSGRGVAFFWLTPNLEYVDPPGSDDGSLRMSADGSLEMAAARKQDSGIYVCGAHERQQNEYLEVNVTVLPPLDPGGAEALNTGFTTLLGCVVSLLLVLVYLYLTPCRCPPWPRPPPPGAAGSSILIPTPPATTEGPGRKVSTNKHVLFLEPIREQQNGRLRVGAEPPQPDSYAAVFSDAPAMLP